MTARAEINRRRAEARKLRRLGWSYPRIARCLGVSPGTARNYLRTAEERRRLRVQRRQSTAKSLPLHLFPTTVPRDWQKQGACRDIDAEVFFPEGSLPDKYDPARAICAACPVATACGQWALNNRIADGMWGGMSPHERRRLLEHPEYKERAR